MRNIGFCLVLNKAKNLILLRTQNKFMPKGACFSQIPRIQTKCMVRKFKKIPSSFRSAGFLISSSSNVLSMPFKYFNKNGKTESKLNDFGKVALVKFAVLPGLSMFVMISFSLHFSINVFTAKRAAAVGAAAVAVFFLPFGAGSSRFSFDKQVQYKKSQSNSPCRRMWAMGKLIGSDFVWIKNEKATYFQIFVTIFFNMHQ